MHVIGARLTSYVVQTWPSASEIHISPRRGAGRKSSPAEVVR